MVVTVWSSLHGSPNEQGCLPVCVYLYDAFTSMDSNKHQYEPLVAYTKC